MAGVDHTAPRNRPRDTVYVRPITGKNEGVNPASIARVRVIDTHHFVTSLHASCSLVHNYTYIPSSYATPDKKIIFLQDRKVIRTFAGMDWERWHRLDDMATPDSILMLLAQHGEITLAQFADHAGRCSWDTIRDLFNTVDVECEVVEDTPKLLEK